MEKGELASEKSNLGEGFVRMAISITFLLSLLVVIVIVLFTTNNGRTYTVYRSGSDPNTFGSREFECSGTCHCEYFYDRRYASSIPRGVRYVVLAFTSLLAAKSVKGHFEEECKLQYSTEECPEELIRSEVVDCEPIDYSKTDNDKYYQDLHEKKFEMKPIGVIRTPFTNRSVTPFNQKRAKGKGATIQIFKEYILGLNDLDGFSHIYVFFVFDRIGGTSLLVHPRGDRSVPERGVFSTRAPVRPNSIGMSLVEILKIEGNVIHIDGIDTLDGTPVVDIKPYFGELSDEEKEKVKTGYFQKYKF